VSPISYVNSVNVLTTFVNLHNAFQVTVVVRKAAEDCVIQTDSGGTLPVPKGTIVAPMANAMHHNRV
jgi:hypothetical protein